MLVVQDPVKGAKRVGGGRDGRHVIGFQPLECRQNGSGPGRRDGRVLGQRLVGRQEQGNPAVGGARLSGEEPAERERDYLTQLEIGAAEFVKVNEASVNLGG